MEGFADLSKADQILGVFAVGLTALNVGSVPIQTIRLATATRIPLGQ